MKYSLPRITEELTKYVIDRQDFSSPHQDHPRNEWIRSILRGMAEVSGENGDQAAANFDQCLERVWGMPSRTWLSSFEEKHIIRILYRYAAGLEQLEGDQRGRVLEVLKLLNDMFIPTFSTTVSSPPKGRWRNSSCICSSTVPSDSPSPMSLWA